MNEIIRNKEIQYRSVSLLPVVLDHSNETDPYHETDPLHRVVAIAYRQWVRSCAGHSAWLRVLPVFGLMFQMGERLVRYGLQKLSCSLPYLKMCVANLFYNERFLRSGLMLF